MKQKIDNFYVQNPTSEQDKCWTIKYVLQIWNYRYHGDCNTVHINMKEFLIFYTRQWMPFAIKQCCLLVVFGVILIWKFKVYTTIVWIGLFLTIYSCFLYDHNYLHSTLFSVKDKTSKWGGQTFLLIFF